MMNAEIIYSQYQLTLLESKSDCFNETKDADLYLRYVAYSDSKNKKTEV